MVTVPSPPVIRERYDAIVVGAGPAGSAAAVSILRAHPQARVGLVDKSEFPRDKCCGDGLGPGVVEVVERLGLKGVLDGEVPVTGCTVLGPGAESLDAELPRIDGRSIVGYVIPRVDFDDRVRANALALGAEPILGRFAGTDLIAGGRAVQLEVGRQPVEVETGLLIGADGASSRVRKALGVDRNGDRTTGIAIRAYVDVPEPGPRRLLFEFSERLLPAYAWYFPGSGLTANIGLGVLVRDHKRSDIDLQDMLAEFCDMLRGRGVPVGEPRGVRTYLLPFATRLPRLAHERAVLIGDAGSMINPLSGEGIFYGMAAGAMVGEAVAGSLRLGLDPSVDLRRFEHEFKQRFTAHYRSNALAQQMLRSPRWSRMMIRAAARDEAVLANAVQLLFGEGTITARSTAQVLRAGLRRR